MASLIFWHLRSGFLNLPVEPAGVFQVLRVRVPFGNAAYHFKGTKGIVALAAEFAQNRAMLFPGNIRHCFGSGAFSTTVSVHKKDGFAFGQVLPGKGHHGFLKFKTINARSKADAIIVIQPNSLAGGYIDQVKGAFRCHGFQNFQSVPVMTGIIANRGFHQELPPCRVQPKSLW